MTIQKLAGELFDAFEQGTRDDGNAFWKIRDGSPDWMTAVIRDAHGDMMPDDLRYEQVRDAAGDIADAGEDADLDRARDEYVDSVDVYNHDLIRWLGSHGTRYGYVDEAVENYGWPESGLMRALMMGQAAERDEVWGSVLASLESLCEDA